MKYHFVGESSVPPSTMGFLVKGVDPAKVAWTLLQLPPQFPAGTCFDSGDPSHWRKKCAKVNRGSACVLFFTSDHIYYLVGKMLLC